MEVTHYVLGAYSQKTEVLGVSVGSEGNNLIMTSKTEGVQVYDVDDQKKILSWVMKPKDAFTTQTIQHPLTKRLYAAKGSDIFSWDESATSLTSSLQAKAGAEIFEILPHPADNSVLIVGVDGQCSILKENESRVSSLVKPQHSGNVLWASCCEVGDRKYLILLQDSAKDSNSYFSFFSFHFDSTLKFTSTLVYPLKDIHSCSLQPQSDVATVSVLHGGTWEVLELDVTSHRIESLLQRKLDDKWALSKNKSRLQLLGLDHSYCVIVSDVGDGDEDHVTVWDIRYGVVHHSLTVDFADEGNKSRVGRKGSKLVQAIRSEDGSRVLLCFDQALVVCPIYCPPLSLASSMGKMGATEKYLAASSAPDSAKGIGNVNSGVSHLRKSVAEDWGSEDDGGDGVLQIERQPDIADIWEKEVRAAAPTGKDPRVHITTSSSKKDFTAAVTKYFSQFNSKKTAESNALPDPHHLQVAVERCLKDGLWDSLPVIVQTNTVSAKANPSLISSILEKNQLTVLEACLVHIHDLPETDLVKVIRFILLEANEKALGDFSKQKKKSKGVIDGDSPLEVFLHLVISSPRNDVFLQNTLKTLSLQEVKVVLTYLKKWVARYSSGQEIEIRNKFTGRFPTFSQVLDWICLLCDAHFTDLVIIQDFGALLNSLHRLTGDQIKLCEKMKGLKGHLRQFANQSTVPSSNVPDYSIEIVNF